MLVPCGIRPQNNTKKHWIFAVVFVFLTFLSNRGEENEIHLFRQGPQVRSSLTGDFKLGWGSPYGKKRREK